MVEVRLAGLDRQTCEAVLFDVGGFERTDPAPVDDGAELVRLSGGSPGGARALAAPRL